MDKRKWIVSFLAALLVIAMIFGFIGYLFPVMTVPVAAAKSSSQIQEELNNLEQKKKDAQAKLDALQLEIDAHMTEFEKVMAEKSFYDQEVTLVSQQIYTINEEISAYIKMIADKQEELEDTEKELEALQAKNKERIRAMEKHGKLSYWSVIFKANNFSDLLDRLKMVREIQANDKACIEAICTLMEEIADAKTELEGEKKKLEAVEEELLVKQADLEEKRVKANDAMARMVAMDEEFKALKEQAEANLGTIKQNILDKQEEYDEAKEKEQQENLQQNPPSGNACRPTVDSAGRTWLTPCKYYYVSSPFGMRWHPVHGGYRMHNGVDLAADSGEPIYAVRNGVVNTASFEEWGAGNYVFIDHQDGYQTAYMHMTHYIVYPGQYVYAGQVIGYVGSTGASSGPHLHFGVYKNWSAVNPADYINF